MNFCVPRQIGLFAHPPLIIYRQFDAQEKSGAPSLETATLLAYVLGRKERIMGKEIVYGEGNQGFRPASSGFGTITKRLLLALLLAAVVPSSGCIWVHDHHEHHHEWHHDRDYDHEDHD
jgi:hypothetical protein